MTDNRKQPRSVFWVATTHALTTGFVMPLLAAGIGAVVANAMMPKDGPPSLGPLYVYFVIYTAGYAIGTNYSLGYIKKVAIIDEPKRCTGPSIIAFGVLMLVGIACHAARVQFAPWPTGVLLALCGLAFSVFIKRTRHGFENWEMEPTESSIPALIDPEEEHLVQYRVVGYDRHTGRDVDEMIRAETAADAKAVATEQGVAVAHVVRQSP